MAAVQSITEFASDSSADNTLNTSTDLNTSDISEDCKTDTQNVNTSSDDTTLSNTENVSQLKLLKNDLDEVLHLILNN